MRGKVLGTLTLTALLAGYLLGTSPGTPPPLSDEEVNASTMTVDAPAVPHARSLMDWFMPRVEAQVGDFRGFQKTFPAQTTVGATASSGLMRGIAMFHTIELITTGGPATCTYRLQGTRDAVTWFNISAADITCTTTSITFESAAKPAVQIRGNLTALTGGTTPSVVLKYIGR